MSNLIIGLILGFILHMNVTKPDAQAAQVATEEVSEAAVKAVAATTEQDGKEEKLYKVSFTYATPETGDPFDRLQTVLLQGMRKGESAYGWDIEPTKEDEDAN